MGKERFYSRDYKVNKETVTRLRDFLGSVNSGVYLDCSQSDFEVYRARQGRSGKIFIINGGLEAEVLPRGVNGDILRAVRDIVNKKETKGGRR
jgi:hypothetical protein